VYSFKDGERGEDRRKYKGRRTVQGEKRVRRAHFTQTKRADLGFQIKSLKGESQEEYSEKSVILVGGGERKMERQKGGPKRGYGGGRKKLPDLTSRLEEILEDKKGDYRGWYITCRKTGKRIKKGKKIHSSTVGELQLGVRTHQVVVRTG